jgi:hypothetical protein
MFGHALKLRSLLSALPLLFLPLVSAIPVQAQTDEIQVYDAEINERGKFNVVWHNNYTPIGRKEADFPGGVVPNHSLIGVPEWAYGVSDWLELGAYVPLYSLTDGHRFLINGAKLRTLFVVPRAKKRTFFYGVNFELSYNSRHWETSRWSGEVRPIVGVHLGPVDLVLNPILDTDFNGFKNLDFAPAARVAYNFSETWTAALEHYADFGKVSGFATVKDQQQVTFAVMDYNRDPNSVEFGIGHGFTAGSDDLVLKLMLIHNF